MLSTFWIQVCTFPKVQISSASAPQLLRHMAGGYSSSSLSLRQEFYGPVLPREQPGAIQDILCPCRRELSHLKTSKCLKGLSFRVSCREVSSRAPDLLFHQKIREGKFVGDQTNRNTLGEAVGEAGEAAGFNEVGQDPCWPGVAFPHSSHPMHLPRHHQPWRGQWGSGMGNKAPAGCRSHFPSLGF